MKKSWVVVGSLLLVLSACGGPAPESTAVQRPSVRPTPTPTLMIEDTATPELPTSTNQASVDRIEISGFQLSTLGQLLFYVKNKLFVLNPVPEFHDAPFERVSFVSETAWYPSWSPDGVFLLYYESESEITPVNGRLLLRPLAARRGEYLDNINPEIKELVERNMSPRAGDWSPDNFSLLFLRLKLTEENFTRNGIVSVVGVLSEQISHSKELVGAELAGWLAEDTIYVYSTCGFSCSVLYFLNYPGFDVFHAIRGIGSDNFTISDDSSLVVNLGRVESFKELGPYEIFLDEFDVLTRESRVLWKIAEGEEPHVEYSLPPTVSPEKRFVTFHLVRQEDSKRITRLYILERATREVVEFMDNKMVINWRPGGGVVVGDDSHVSDTNHLLYLPLNWSKNRDVLVPSSDIYRGDEEVDLAWSSDGTFLLMNIVNEAAHVTRLYLWEFDTGEPVLIEVVNSDQHIPSLWLPDSQSFYFGSVDGLWQYFVTDGSRGLVYAIDDASP